jgi:hypothetical protein
MTKTDCFAFGRGRDHIADLNLLTSNYNTVNQQLNELALLFKGRFTDSLLHPLAEGFYRLDHASQLIVMAHIGFQLALLFLNDRQSLFQFLLSPFEFVELKHIGQIGIG